MQVKSIMKIIDYSTIETWCPRAEGLDPIRITRSVPIIYILISQEKLSEDEEGYVLLFCYT